MVCLFCFVLFIVGVLGLFFLRGGLLLGFLCFVVVFWWGGAPIGDKANASILHWWALCSNLGTYKYKHKSWLLYTI